MVLMMVVAMVNSSLLESFIRDETKDGQARLAVFKYWGSFVRAYTSMFEITLANWGPQCWLLMNNVHTNWGMFFIFWKCLVGFAVIQVISSVFIQQTFKVAAQDEELMIEERKRASLAFIRHLESLFAELDQSGEGSISREEFQRALTEPRFKYFFG